MENQNLRIRSTVVPQDRPEYNEWSKMLGAGSAYIKPTNYFTGNHFEPVSNNNSLFNRILNWLNIIS